MNPNTLIQRIRESHSKMPQIFTDGSCYNFFLILSAVFPDAEAWYNSDHIITKIGDRYWDINGEVLHHDTYLPLSDYYTEPKVKRLVELFLKEESNLENDVHFFDKPF